MLDQSNQLPIGDSENQPTTQPQPRTRVQFEFQTDPGKYYVFLLVLHSGFKSVTDISNYLKANNQSLLPILNSLLVEMEQAKIITVDGDQIDINIEKIDLSLNFADVEILADFARTTIHSAVKSHEGFQFGLPQKTVGFRNLAIPFNRRTIGRLNAICERFQSDLLALIDETGDAERPEFMYVNVSRSLLRPEDF